MWEKIGLMLESFTWGVVAGGAASLILIMAIKMIPRLKNEYSSGSSISAVQAMMVLSHAVLAIVILLLSEFSVLRLSEEYYRIRVVWIPFQLGVAIPFLAWRLLAQRNLNALFVRAIMVVLALAIIVLALAKPVRSFLREDSCLDGGGVWHPERDSCYTGK